MSWTDERVEQLRQAWMEGKSASQIASLLGHGLTRNAVIGKVHRLGLAGRAKVAEPGAPRRPLARPAASAGGAPGRAAFARPRRRAARIVRGATALAIQPQALAEAQPEEIESVVLPMSVRVTIVELKESMCRWPLGDPASAEFRYCGSPTHADPTAPTTAASPISRPTRAGAIATAASRCADGASRRASPYVLPNVSSKA